MEIAEIRTIQIANDCSVNTQWSSNIFVPFTPDEVIVTQYAYTTDPTAEHDNKLNLVWTDLIDDNALFVFPGGGTNSTGISTGILKNKFLLRGTINRSFKFILIEPVANILATTPKGDLSFTLQFIKYKNK